MREQQYCTAVGSGGRTTPPLPLFLNWLLVAPLLALLLRALRPHCCMFMLCVPLLPLLPQALLPLGMSRSLVICQAH